MEVNNCVSDLLQNAEKAKKGGKVNSTFNNSSRGEFSNILNRIVSRVSESSNDLKYNNDENSISDVDNLIEQYELRCITEKLKDMAGKQDSAVERLARQFGISKQLMSFILNNLGISASDLLNPAKKREILAKLSDYFSLDKKKTEKIGQVLDNIQEVSIAG